MNKPNKTRQLDLFKQPSPKETLGYDLPVSENYLATYARDVLAEKARKAAKEETNE